MVNPFSEFLAPSNCYNWREYCCKKTGNDTA